MKKLPVPEKISLRKEYWRGFGNQEAVRSARVLAVVLSITAAVCLLGAVEEPAMVLGFVGIITAFLCANFFGRMDQNQSMYEYLVRLRRFHTEQQTFRYEHEREVLYVAAQDES